MASRRVRLLILAFLGLLIAAPLSSGDKGLWLSVTSTPMRALEASVGRLAAEHSTLLPDRGSSTVAATRAERPKPTKGTALLATIDGLPSGVGLARTGPAASCKTPQDGCSSRAAPRAPPA